MDYLRDCSGINTDIIKDKMQISNKMQINDIDILLKKYNALHVNILYGQELAKIGSWSHDIQTDFVFYSEGVYRIFECSEEDLEGKPYNYYQYIQKEDLEKVESAVLFALEGKEYDIEYRIVTPAGIEKYINEKAKALYDENNNPIKMIGVMQDISKSKRIEMNLKELGDNLSLGYRIEGIGVWKYDAYRGKVFFSDEVYRIFDFNSLPAIDSYDEFINLVHPQDHEKFINNVKECFKGHARSFVYKTNNLFHAKSVKSLVKPIYNSDKQVIGIIGTVQDITEKVELERKISYIATHDELTSLPNQVFFREQIELKSKEAKMSGELFGLIILDIDGFKYISDALGYHIADQLIIEIAERLKSFVSNEDIISRHSIDQFSIIVNNVKEIEDFKNYADDLIQLFKVPFKVDKLELNITVGMGISIFPEHGGDAETLKKHADSAMLQSKRMGKNIYQFYSTEMDISKYKEFELGNDLRKATAKGQLRVYYQPIVRLETNEIIAAEALVRWEHPTLGLISPNEFIPIAEDTGYIVDIGNWMLKEVCKNYLEWQKQNMPPIKISINYSSIQFYEKDFVENIIETINEYHISPRFLIVEIVESVLINDFNQVATNINKLRSYGIKIALDDFGTGFSSLQYLNRFNIDILKLDRSFIKNIPFEESSTIITDSVVSLARNLKIKLVAEGIENFEQIEFLTSINCYSGQGFIYNKPIPKLDFERVLSNQVCVPNIIDNN